MDRLSLHFVFLGITAAAACAMGGLVAWMVRGVTFFSTNTDNWKMVRQAASLKFLGWPSAMHRDPRGRAQCREYWVIFLALMQRLLRDRTTDYPNVILALASHAASSVLLFVVASHYWSPVIGLWIAGIYLSSFWPLQVALFLGHVELSQAFMLLSVLMTQWARAAAPWEEAIVYNFLFGVFAAVSFFSSTSSRKYVPLLAGAFLYSQRDALIWPPVFSPAASGAIFGGAALLLGSLFSGIGSRLSGDRVLRKVFRALAALLLLSGVYVLLCASLTHSPRFYWAHLWALLGSCAVFLHVMLPDLGCGLRRFHFWFNTAKWAGHFMMYRDFFSRIGRPIKEDMRGAGFLWVYRFFAHVVPFVVVLWAGSLLVVLGVLVMGGMGPASVLGAAGLVLLSLSPLLLGEFTRGSQQSRANFPGLTGLLVLIGAAAYGMDRSLVGGDARVLFWVALGGALGGNAAWNVWVFLKDVWPARMAPAWLARTLRQMGVRRFYTYATPYNDAFIGVLSEEERSRYEIRYIRSLTEVEGDVLVVPGTSSKALNMESHEWAIQHGDFDEDPILSGLIQSRQIERYALASFQTFGTSAMFVHESDVTSYRHLILQEITDQDQWRARAWVLDGARLRQDFQMREAARDCQRETIGVKE